MAIQTVADLVARSTTSSPTVTSGQYRTERENVMASIGLEKAKPPVAAVSSNPPKMYFGQAPTSAPEVKPQGQGQSPFSGSMVAPPRTDYATGISAAERSRTGSGRQVSAQDRTNDVLGLVRQGISSADELQRYLNVNQAGGLASGYTRNELQQIIDQNAQAVQEGQQYRQQAIAGGATPQTLEQGAMSEIEAIQKRREQSFNTQQQYLNRQFDQQSQATQAAQQSETGSTNLQLARMGAFTAASGVSYGNSLAEKQRRELSDLETKRMGALQAAQDAYDEDMLEIAYKKLEEARNVKKEQAAARAAQLDEMKKYEELRKYEKEDLSATFEGMIEDGVDVDSIPEGYIEQQYPNLTRMDAITLFNTVKRDRAAKTKKTAQEQKKADTENARDIQNILQKVPLGQQITIGGVEYTGLERGDIKTGTETAPDGSVTFWSYDENTGETKTTSLGTIGQKKDGWDLKFDADGNPWKFNGQTGQLLPSYPSITQTAVQQVIPDGSISPFKDEKGNPRVQCGEFVNDMTGIGVGDTFESKMAKMNLWKKGDNIQSIVSQLKPGDVFTQKLGTWTGHVGTILGVETAPNGQIQIRALESNYPQAGKVTSTRLIPIEKIDGFGRGSKVSPVLKTGPDSATFATKTEKAKDDLLSPAEIKILGVPYGTTKTEAAKMKITPAGEGTTALSDKQIKAVESSPEAKQLISLKDLKNKLQAYKNVVSSLDSFASFGANASKVDALYSAAQIAWKEAAALGALTGPDLDLIYKALKPMSGLKNYPGFVAGGGKAGVTASLDAGLDTLNTSGSTKSKTLISKYGEYKDDPYIVDLTEGFGETVKPDSASETIRVKLKSSGKTGRIPPGEFDANLYERL